MSSNIITSLELESFFEMLLSEVGLSLLTVSSYRSDLQDFDHYLSSNADFKGSVCSLGKSDITDYLADCAERELHNRTILRRLSCLRHFFRFLVSEGQLSSNPCDGLETVKSARYLPFTPSKDDIKTLFHYLHKRCATSKTLKSSFNNHRLCAMLEMLYASGMRISELLELPALILSKAGDSIHIKGKGNKTRIVILNEHALASYEAYLDSGRVLNLWRDYPPRYAFVLATDLHKALTRQGFSRSLKKLARLAGLSSERLSAHSLRHAFASHLLENGADLRSVQRLLGHSHITTTEIYTHIQPERLLKTVSLYHPLGSRK